MYRAAFYLVKEYVFSVPAFRRKVFQISILVDTMFLTKLLPELASNYTKLSRSSCASQENRILWWKAVVSWNILLLPHWPAWIVIISLRLSISSAIGYTEDLSSPGHCCKTIQGLITTSLKYTDYKFPYLQTRLAYPSLSIRAKATLGHASDVELDRFSFKR